MNDRGRMTYEQQRALREQQRSRAADRYTVDNYGSNRYSGADMRRSESYSRNQSTRQSETRRSSAQRSARTSTTRTSRETGYGTRANSYAQGRSSTRPQRQTTRDQFSRANYGTQAAGRPPLFKIAIAAVLVVAVVLLVQLCSAIVPITVTVNGTSYELRGAKTMQTAIKTSGLPVNPGDLISLNGNILEKSAGQPFSATVNDTQTADPDYRLRDGDVINITDGDDIVEDYDSVEEGIPYSSSIVGIGAVHKFEAGQEGVLEIRTGRISGETVEKQVAAPVDITCTQYNLNTGNDKVIALTFDDGPSGEYTAAVLDILAENNVKATFFVIGTEVEEHPELVEREAAEGHQVCTHSYDHADPVGGTDVSLMDANGQIDEIVHGYQTITNVLGGEASRVIRAPGGNLSSEMVMNLQPYVDYEIGWNIDTQDWTLPGSDAIYNQIISAEPGDIILCHDGGGDRSETVEAIRRAIPYMKSKGYTFVTMDEILAYPARS